MADTVLRSGNPQTIDYTPTGGDIALGEVVNLVDAGSNTVEVGLALGIADRAIENNVKGALSIYGGIYDVVNLNNAANYATVYWSAATSKVTTVSTNNARFGYIVTNGGGGANSTCQALHIGFNDANLA